MYSSSQSSNRSTLSLAHSRARQPMSGEADQQAPQQSFGHEAILKTIIKNRRIAILAFSNGEVVRGRLSQFDDETITIYPEDNGGIPETFFKHALRSFTVEPVIEGSDDARDDATGNR